MAAFTIGLKTPQNSSKSELLKEINQLKDTIDSQNAILKNMTTIETEILQMKAINQDKQQIFANLNKEIDELRRINTKLRERIMVWKRNSPEFVPQKERPPELNSDVPEFVQKPKKLPPHRKIFKLPNPESNSNLRY